MHLAWWLLIQRLKSDKKNAYGQNIRQLLPADSLQFFTQAHRISVRRKKRISCIFGPSHFCPSPATSRGSNPSSVLRIVPQCASFFHLHTAEHEAKWATWQPTRAYTANYTQHSRYTTRYTTRNTTEMLPGAAFQVRTEKLTCILISFLQSLKAPKCCPCQQFGSVACSVACRVACSVACSVAWGCHATLVTFTCFFERILLPPSRVRQPFSRHASAALPSLCCNIVTSTCTCLMTFNSKVEIWQEKCIWPKHPSASARWFFAVLHPGT